MNNDILVSRYSLRVQPRSVINLQPTVARTTAVTNRPMNDIVRPSSAIQQTTTTEITETFDYSQANEYSVHALLSQIEVVETTVISRQIIESTADRSESIFTRLRDKVSPKTAISGAALMILLAVTGYISIDTLTINNQIKAESTVSAAAIISEEGADERPVEKSAVDNYMVSADMPRALTINKLNISARIMPMSVSPDGRIQAPINIFDSGWYNGSAKPGTPGASLIDGHASGKTRKGLFAYLDTLAVGDTLSVEKGDGTKLSYRVTKTETIALNDLDSSTLLKTYGGVAEGLNLVTCTGKWIESEKTYDQRVVVYTERIDA